MIQEFITAVDLIKPALVLVYNTGSCPNKICVRKFGCLCLSPDFKHVFNLGAGRKGRDMRKHLSVVNQNNDWLQHHSTGVAHSDGNMTAHLKRYQCEQDS